MSLKSFHIFFILVSIVLCGGVAYWAYGELEFSSDWYLKPLLGFSLVSALGLAVYLSNFIKKIRKLPALSALILSFYTSPAWGCAVCYGDPNSPIAKSTNAGVSFMLVIVAIVLSFFGYGLIRLLRKDRLYNQV